MSARLTILVELAAYFLFFRITHFQRLKGIGINKATCSYNITMGFLEWSTANRDQFLYFSICLSIPSIALYCVEIITIIRHKEYRSSFNKLFVIRAIADLLYVLNSYYSFRLPLLFGTVLYPIYSTFPNWMIVLDFFNVIYSFEANNLATAFMLLNRLTAIAMPVKHKRLWDKFLLAVLFIVYGFPILDCWPVFNINGILLIENANSSTVISFFLYEDGDAPHVTYVSDMLCVFAIIFMILCVIINILIVLAYKSHAKKTSENDANNMNRRIELKLFVYTLITFLGHVLIACLMIGLHFANTAADLTTVTALLAHFPWIMDTGTVVLSSWLLLWAADSFRQQMFKDFGVPQIPFGNRSNNDNRVTTLVGSGSNTINVNGITQRSSRIK